MLKAEREEQILRDDDEPVMAGGALGGVLVIEALDALGLHGGVVALGAGVIGACLGAGVAYAIGDRLNERAKRLRAPIGSASVGVDGIRWRRFGRTEFVGWAKVREVELRGPNEVVVHVEGGPDVVLLIEAANAVVAAARAALQGYRDASPPESIAALESTGEPLADWLGRARKLLQRGSYRDADIGEDHCVRVAIDPRAPAAQRIGSAATLSRASEGARARVRIAIEETADPIVANALEGRDSSPAMRKAISLDLTRC